MRGFLQAEEEQAKCCGSCKWHHAGDIDGDWVCVNGDSVYCAEYTDYSDNCTAWEER